MYLLHCKDMKYSGKREHLNGRILSFWDHKMEHDYGIRPVYLPPLCIMHPPLRSPLRFSASRACQSALIKQFVTKAGAMVFLYRGFELIAFFESVSAYLSYWDGDIHCGEAVETIERAITYTGHTGRDCHGQTPADIHFQPQESVMPTKGNRDVPRSPWREKLMPSRQISKKRLEMKGRKREKKKRSTAWWQTMLLCLL